MAEFFRQLGDRSALIRGHGAGAIPHEVATAEAEGVVAAAASSIAYLAKKLP